MIETHRLAPQIGVEERGMDLRKEDRDDAPA